MPKSCCRGSSPTTWSCWPSSPPCHTALLTPQGKILFEFFVAKAGDGYVLETAADQAADLVRRLTMYKLRAKVDIHDDSAGYSVMAVWE